jgi:cob(I)alamin adenosyltransferase
MEMDKKREGLIYIYTGNGKGKTTAAIGQAVRALGRGWHVAVLQFIKSEVAGEISFLQENVPSCICELYGEGFTWLGDEALHREGARRGWDRAKELLHRPELQLLVLDELTYCITNGYLDIDEVTDALEKRKKDLHVVITGRNVHEKLVEQAHLVSSIDEIKHHFNCGKSAVEGIEF